ncbi:MAG: hypothetical protein ABIJ26_05315 [Candidatus Margulisiibacteriota bacterium]|nr:YkgJ family cysteine cluster protein [Candidatus Margulisiibacteriota bacterium]
MGSEIIKHLKRLIISVMVLDNAVVQGLKKLFPHKYKITGRCKRCGNCCREIHLKMTPRQIRSEFFRNLCIKWLVWLYDFILLEVNTEYYYLSFTCKHIGEDGKCQNYTWRYNICRNYPLLDYFEEPKFLPGCGFKKMEV